MRTLSAILLSVFMLIVTVVPSVAQTTGMTLSGVSQTQFAEKHLAIAEIGEGSNTGAMSFTFLRNFTSVDSRSAEGGVYVGAKLSGPWRYEEGTKYGVMIGANSPSLYLFGNADYDPGNGGGVHWGFAFGGARQVGNVGSAALCLTSGLGLFQQDYSHAALLSGNNDFFATVGFDLRWKQSSLLIGWQYDEDYSVDYRWRYAYYTPEGRGGGYVTNLDRDDVNHFVQVRASVPLLNATVVGDVRANAKTAKFLAGLAVPF